MGLNEFPLWSRLLRVLIILATLTIILTGIYLASALINQVMLSLFLAIMLDPLISRLERKRVPRLLSSLLVIVLLLLVIVFTIIKLTVLTPDLIQLSRQAPQLLAERFEPVTQTFSHLGLVLTPNDMLAFVDAGAVVRFVTGFLTQIPSILSWWLMVFLMLFFMLYEMRNLKILLRKQAEGKYQRYYVALEEGVQSVIVYAQVKTLTSIVGGIIVWAGAHLLGLKFAFFWGVLMFVFNYIPVLGSFMAAIPPVLQSYMLYDIQTALVVALFFVALNLILSSVIEPLLLGKRLNMALTTQLLAFLIWQSLLGIIGAILAIPLTFMLKKILLASAGNEKQGEHFPKRSPSMPLCLFFFNGEYAGRGRLWSGGPRAAYAVPSFRSSA